MFRKRFAYPHEGWGITHDGKRIIMSDGTSVLQVLDSKDFHETAIIRVYDERGPVAGLNELEYVQGTIFANVWPTDHIAVIDPGTGRVKAWIDLRGLLAQSDSPGASSTASPTTPGAIAYSLRESYSRSYLKSN
jgi:glutamine cyclotransferase